MTSKPRKLPNRRSCFLFRIEGYGSCRHVRQPSISHDAISAELDDRLPARTEFQCKRILCVARERTIGFAAKVRLIKSSHKRFPSSLIRGFLRALFICIVSRFRIRRPESLLAQSI